MVLQSLLYHQRQKQKNVQFKVSLGLCFEFKVCQFSETISKMKNKKGLENSTGAEHLARIVQFPYILIC